MYATYAKMMVYHQDARAVCPTFRQFRYPALRIDDVDCVRFDLVAGGKRVGQEIVDARGNMSCDYLSRVS